MQIIKQVMYLLFTFPGGCSQSLSDRVQSEEFTAYLRIDENRGGDLFPSLCPEAIRSRRKVARLSLP